MLLLLSEFKLLIHRQNFLSLILDVCQTRVKMSNQQTTTLDVDTKDPVNETSSETNTVDTDLKAENIEKLEISIGK